MGLTIPLSPTTRRAAPPSGSPPTLHRLLLCVALPCLAVSVEHGQLTGEGLGGFYQGGRRILSRCRLRVDDLEPVPLQGSLVGAATAQFFAVLPSADAVGPDPDVSVERVRDADGTERITLRSSARVPRAHTVELALGSDLAQLPAVAAGRPGPDLPAAVHGSGLRWVAPDGSSAVVTVEPPPRDVLAVPGLLRWHTVVRPGASFTVELRVRSGRPLRPAGRSGGSPLPGGSAEGDDPRVARLFAASLEDLRGLLQRGPGGPADLYLAAGVPWRCGAPAAEALWAARMALPVGTALAAATLRTLARGHQRGPGVGAGRIPGPLRDAGPHLPPSCTGTEATLAFPAVLAEAYRWGLPERDLEELLPAAERCLSWLRAAAGADGLLAEPGPGGPCRAETQAHAHRAAVLGAELLEECNRPGAQEWREWASALRETFAEAFWLEDRAGGRPAAARTADGRPVPYLSGSLAHLLDTGLAGGGRHAPGLLDGPRTARLARILGGPALDSGWGLRGLGEREPGYNPFGHRAGAVRVHETAVAVGALAAAERGTEASALLRGLMDAADSFGYRLPEMFAGRRRTPGTGPVPHPGACRPAAVAAAAGVHAITALAGVRPDAPARTVTLRPLREAPLGAVRLSGLRVAGRPFSVRVGRLGLAMVEEAADGLQLGV